MALTQGEGASESVLLPSGWCSPNNCLRAFICAEAVLRPQNSGIEAFLRGIQKEFPFIEFGDIHVSVDLNPDYGFKFLVADAADAIFIAFQVSQNFNNSLGSALCTLPSGGQVDNAVFTLTEDLKILTDIYGFHKEKRIVFCGHEFGGALAHMVVLQFLAPLFKTMDKAIKEKREMISMISIAFGAPYICSSAYAKEVNGNNELKSHFFDFVHEHDPRRSILCDYGRDGVSTENTGRGCNLGGGRVGIWNGITDRANEVAFIRKATTQMNRAYRLASLKTCQEPKFFPIGENSLLKGSNTSGAWGWVPQSRSNPWSRDKFFNSYKSALTLHLALPTSESEPSDPNSKLVLRVTTPTPVIKSAKLKAMDSGSFVHIEGKNLLFLREPVKMNALNPWICKIQKDDELCLFEPPQTDAKTEGNDMENALTFIVLKTAFGKASHLILENNMSGGTPAGVRSLLFKIAQTFVALASAPLCITQSSELLDDLDSIVQCVPDLKDEKLSKVLKEIANANADKDLKVDIIKINTTIEKVVEFLTRSCKIKYMVTLPIKLGMAVGASLLLAGLTILLPLSAISYVVGGAATGLYTSGCVATSAGVASSSVAIYLSKNELMIPEYRATLEIAIQEANLWHGEGQTSELPEKTEVELESLLLEEVERSGSRLTDMMESIHKSGAKAQDIVFRSKPFEGATLKSKGNLLRRMQIVTKTLHLYNKKVKNIRFVGVFGAEDAGKSTFIRKAVRHFGGKLDSELPTSELPEVGFHCHTTMVRAYKIRTKENLYLVDFPGSNGTGAYADAWKQFTSLPSSCVLLLDFKDDIKKDQVEMYKKMKQDLGGSKVTVVFNKVDEKFTPRREAAYNAECFDQQRDSTAKMLECDRSDVHFACLDPDPEEKLIKLKKVGVLDFEELFKKVV